MILDFIRLAFTSVVGYGLTFFNLFKTTNIHTTEDIVSFHFFMLNGSVGILTGVLTCIYLFWQIKKIRRDLKEKHNK